MLFADLVETLQGMIKDRGFACLIYYIDEEEDEVQQAIQICVERLPMGILFLGSNLENFRKGLKYLVSWLQMRRKLWGLKIFPV